MDIRDYADFGFSGNECCGSSVCMTDMLTKISPDVIYNNIVDFDMNKFNKEHKTDLTIKNFKETTVNSMYDYDIYQYNGNNYIGWGRVKITDTIESI